MITQPASVAARPLKILAFIILVAATASCYRVRNELIATPEPPFDLYRCVQLEPGKAGYAIVGADRASGWLHAQKRKDRIISVDRAEIHATVIPDESGEGSHLQLTDNSHAADDAEKIRATCASP